MSTKQHAEKVLRLLEATYPDAHMILTYSNPWELLVAVMLSAQCTDVTVNKVTPSLFAKYKTMQDYADGPIEELEALVRSTGFYHNKAKNIKAAAALILDKFHGEIPKTMKEMLEIPGVARKTANVVLGNAYHVVEGIAVDTHVTKQSQQLGLTKQTNPDKIEKDLMALFDKKDWFRITYLLIEHGRTIRLLRKPDPNYEARFLAKLR